VLSRFGDITTADEGYQNLYLGLNNNAWRLCPFPIVLRLM
jgi:hypothetical protein